MRKFLKLEFNTDIKFLKLVDFSVESFFKEENISEKELFNLSFSVRECVINSIKHGNKFDKDKKIAVLIEYFQSRKLFRCGVRDEGSGFNLEELPDPSIEDNILKSSGRGIFLVKNYMDKISLIKLKNGFKIIIEKKLV